MHSVRDYVHVLFRHQHAHRPLGYHNLEAPESILVARARVFENGLLCITTGLPLYLLLHPLGAFDVVSQPGKLRVSNSTHRTT